jgi:hypothetical protein
MTQIRLLTSGAADEQLADGAVQDRTVPPAEGAAR